LSISFSTVLLMYRPALLR